MLTEKSTWICGPDTWKKIIIISKWWFINSWNKKKITLNKPKSTHHMVCISRHGDQPDEICLGSRQQAKARGAVEVGTWGELPGEPTKKLVDQWSEVDAAKSRTLKKNEKITCFNPCFVWLEVWSIIGVSCKKNTLVTSHVRWSRGKLHSEKDPNHDSSSVFWSFLEVIEWTCSTTCITTCYEWCGDKNLSIIVLKFGTVYRKWWLWKCIVLKCSCSIV